MKAHYIAVTALICYNLVAITAAVDYIVTNTTDGPIRGFSESFANVYIGIPYAMPPVDQLRWAPPQQLTHRNAIFNATTFGKSCLQLPVGYNNNFNTSEDCLYLNIYAPKNAKMAPIMFWIHGGALETGNADGFDGRDFVNNSNTVVVTTNYRLGPFGFLALEELGTRDGTTGNYGLQDQRFALQWIIKNARSFGGNPNNITIFGESAGAYSVCVHLVAPKSEGLFQAAIMESTYDLCALANFDDAANRSLQIARVAGCSSPKPLDCLLHSDANHMLHASANISYWTGVIDGEEFFMQPEDYLVSGLRQPVPVVMGANKDEEAFFMCGTPLENITSVGLKEYLIENYGQAITPGIYNVYNISSYETPFKALVEISSDSVFKCPSLKIAQLLTLTGAPTWFYSFNYVPRGWCGAGHVAELPFVWKSAQGAFGADYIFTPQEEQLRQLMKDFWLSFAHTHVPSSQSMIWPRFTNPVGQYINLNVSPYLNISHSYDAAHCEFWNFMV